MICRKCGLPIDLCVCLEEAIEENRVQKGLVTGSGVGQAIKKIKGRNPIGAMNESIRKNYDILKGLSGKKECIVKGCSETCKKCDGIQDEGCIYVIVAKKRGKPSSSSPYVPLGKIKNHNNVKEWEPDEDQVMTIEESLKKAERKRKEEEDSYKPDKDSEVFLIKPFKLLLKLSKKAKRKLVVLLGYQISNLAWIGAWATYGTPFFWLFVTLICAADALIIWKELD